MEREQCGDLRSSTACDQPDERQRKKLIEEHVEVAHNIARGLSRRYAWALAAEDIEGTAMVGLCEAAARFDRTRSEPFIAFATQRIRGAVIDEVRRLTLHGRVINRRHRRISEARDALAHLDTGATDERVAAFIGVSLSTMQRTGQRAKRVMNGDISIIPSPLASPEAQVASAQLLAIVNAARGALTTLETLVIQLHYDHGTSLAEIARTNNLTLGRIRHVHASALARMSDAIWNGLRPAERHRRDELVVGPLSRAR